MHIELILTVWLLWALLFCLGLGAAASRPIPQPDLIGSAAMPQPINCQVMTRPEDSIRRMQ